MSQSIPTNPNPYSPGRSEIVSSYHRVHGNAERTHVDILHVGERAYVAVAFDIDPRDYTPVTAECIAFDPTADGAAERARHWMETHPKGVLGDGEGGGGGWGSRISRALSSLDSYGNKLIQQQGGSN